MKRFWTAPAVALLALGLIAGCNNYNNTVQYNTGATIKKREDTHKMAEANKAFAHYRW